MRFKILTGILTVMLILMSSIRDARAQAVSLPPSSEKAITTLFYSWKFKPGDDPSWAGKSFDDSSWDTLSPIFHQNEPGAEQFQGIGWFRLHINVDPSYYGQVMAIMLSQDGASEIYFDGKKVQTWGKVGTGRHDETRINPQNAPFGVYVDSTPHHVIAVRYSNFYSLHVPIKYEHDTPGFSLSISNFTSAIHEINNLRTVGNSILVFIFCFFFTVGFLHLLLYVFKRSQRLNLYFSMFSMMMSGLFIFPFLSVNHTDPEVSSWAQFAILLSLMAMVIFLLALVYYIFYKKMPKAFWVFFSAFIVTLILMFTPLSSLGGMILFIIVVISLIEVARVVIMALVKKKEGARIVGTGLMIFILSILTLFTITVVNGGHLDLGGNYIAIITVILSFLSIPLSMSIHLARNFALMNRNLELQVVQIQDLSAQTIRQEQEKKRILESQKEMLEVQVAERTAEVVLQKREIEEKNKSITDSITYAKRIQQAILPHDEEFGRLLPGSFVLYLPKDIVSGDFYWISRKDDQVFVAAADCTGHGVPGALMSMIGNALLNEIVNEKNITSPPAILQHLHTGIRLLLKQDQLHGETRDGMDIALCRIDMRSRALEYAGAMRPLYIVSGGELKEIKADKYPIGGLQEAEERKFTGHALALSPGDMIYLSSDGFADQFGGDKGKKFMVKKFQQLLEEIYALPPGEQRARVKNVFEQWKGNLEQVDDVLVIGIRIS
jgi:serine phosphatase RsbU (regulator of sigma subunit)